MARSSGLLFAPPPSEGLGRAVTDHAIALAGFERRRFADGEERVRSLVSVRARDVYVLCSVYDDAGESVGDRLCRLLFFVGALRDAGAARITVVAPYLCHSRQDRRTRPRDPLTTRYVAQLLEAVGTDRVVTVDVHNLAAYENAFRIPSEHLEATALFAERCLAFSPRELTIVSPDPGGFRRAEALRDLVQRRGVRAELAMMSKHREDGVHGEEFVGPVAGRVAVIVDDLIATGTTLVRAAEACRELGAVAVHAMATHATFTASAAGVLANPAVDSIVVTDTVSRERVDLGAAQRKLTVLPIAPLLARAIERLHDEASIVLPIEDLEADQVSDPPDREPQEQWSYPRGGHRDA